MTDHAPFLQAICEDPAADAHRLVYADWLEDRGEEARAGFIRHQCHLARYCSSGGAADAGLEAGMLRPEHRQAFLAPLLGLGLVEAGGRYHDGPATGFAFHFRRGFVEQIDVYGGPAAERFVQQAEGVFARTPLLHLVFHSHRAYDEAGAPPLDPLTLPTLAALVRLPVVARLQGLDLRGHALGDAAAWLLMGSAHIRPGTGLMLGGNGITDPAEGALRQRFGRAVGLEPRPPAPVFSADDDIPF